MLFALGQNTDMCRAVSSNAFRISNRVPLRVVHALGGVTDRALSGVDQPLQFGWLAQHDEAAFDRHRAAFSPLSQLLVDALPRGSDEVAEIALRDLEVDAGSGNTWPTIILGELQQDARQAHRQIEQR